MRHRRVVLAGALALVMTVWGPADANHQMSCPYRHGPSEEWDLVSAAGDPRAEEMDARGNRNGLVCRSRLKPERMRDDFAVPR